MSSSISTSSRAQAHRPSVTFSQFSELAFIPQDKNTSLWYSSKERRHFRQALQQDVRRIAREIQDDDISQDHVYERVGIEVITNQSLAKRVVETRYAHVKAVLSEQRIQKQQGIYDVDKLASVSQKTAWTSERARVLATGYWLQYIFDE